MCFVLGVELLFTTYCYELSQLTLKGNRNFNERKKMQPSFGFEKETENPNFFIYLSF